MDFIDRQLGHRLLEAARHFPAVVLCGARQTGKTTLLRHLFPGHVYVSLDRPLTASMADEDPEAFLSRYPAPLLIDEVQYAPRLFRHLKASIDADRHAPGRYILTGSQQFSLMKGISESLAGRVAVFSFEGLSLSELAGRVSPVVDPESWLPVLTRGGYPELWRDPDMPVELFLDSYIATYLERDVRQVLNVGNLRDFERFMRACALRSGQLLNRSELARDIGVSVPTVTSWISVLEALGQIHLLEPWFSSPTKRLVKSPKLYFTDVALMIRFCGLPADQLLFSPFIGAVWETLVYAELRKQLAFEGSRARIWFYRDQSGLEVDFIIDEGSRRQLLECKWAGSPDLRMAEPALALRKQWQNAAAGVQAGASAAMSVGVISRSPEVFTASEVRFSPPAGRWFQPPNE